ncbi:zf-HC2 domain-containing protein [Streptomyces sp. FZ201]|uniref:zf-HC2 domain-containing protein n=1 Tax=Streptomyces sp. FZ201 TaxID=3057122 RepID=UPI0021BEBF7B|nr:zf-HC2 domain-containing protein [Streptomyces sp. FZ201]
MRSLERHRDVAAYALGVLDEADAFRFEDHLMECPSCAARVTEFGPATRQLMLYRNATPRSVHPMAKPGPRLLDRLMGEVAGRSRMRRRRLLFGLAASAAVALASPGIAMMAADGDSSARMVDATDERSGVWAQVTAEEEPWGTQVELKVKDGAGPRACRLIAVGRDGSEQMVTSWTAARHDARENTMMGAAAFHPDEIAHYEVRTTDGEHLVTLALG